MEKNGSSPDQTRAVEDLLYSGLTAYEIELILMNAGPLNFCVNLFGIHNGKIYPIHIGIGSKRSSKRIRKCKIVNLNQPRNL